MLRMFPAALVLERRSDRCSGAPTFRISTSVPDLARKVGVFRRWLVVLVLKMLW